MDNEICHKCCTIENWEGRCCHEHCSFSPDMDCCFECLFLGKAKKTCYENHDPSNDYFKFILLYKKKHRSLT